MHTYYNLKSRSILYGFDIYRTVHRNIQGVPLGTETGISLIILPLMRILQRNLKRTTDTFLFISHTTNVLLFKFRCNIFIGVRIIKEMPGSVASETHCISIVKPIRCTSVSNLFYFGMTLYMFRTVFPSIISSSRLFIQQQAFVKQILLSAC